MFSVLGLLNPLIVPSPLAILLSYSTLASGGDFVSNFSITLFELLAATVIVVSIGLLVGFAIAAHDMTSSVFEPLIIAIFAIPSIVIYPIFFLVLGLGPLSKIAFGVLVGAFPIIQNTVAAVRQVRHEHIVVGRSYGASPFVLFRKIIFPSTASLVIAGIKLGVALTFIGVIAGEMIASQAGLGFLITISFDKFEIALMYGIVLIVVLVALSIYYFLNLLEDHYRIVGYGQAV